MATKAGGRTGSHSGSHSGRAAAGTTGSQAGQAWPPPPRRAHGGRVLILVTAAAVLVAAAGGTALALTRFGRAHATATASTSHRPVTARPRASPSAAPQPTVTPAPSISQPAAVGNSLVSVLPALAGQPAAGPVVTLLTGYFTAINEHDYLAYRRLYGPQSQQALTMAQFMSGYDSTTDSAVVLDAISVPAPGALAATVSFTSHQQPGASPAGSACTDWRITLYLTRQGSSYIIGAPPTGYRATFYSCP